MGRVESNWRRAEGERLGALMSRDAERYALLSFELGIEPEDEELYDQGAQQIQKLESDLKKLGEIADKKARPLKRGKRSVSNAVYGRFYNEGFGLSRSIFEDTGIKRRLLSEHFPRRCGNNGRNPVYRMEPEKVGSLFDSMINYARKRIQENQ